MTTVVVGASAGLGRRLAFRLAEAGHDLVLVAREARDLAAVAADLRVRFGVRVTGVAADVTDDEWLEEVACAAANLGGVDALLLPVGGVAAGDTPCAEPRLGELLWRLNYGAVVACVARFWPELTMRGGVVVGFGSIASVRGRDANAAYAAAKRGLATWFESLRHLGAQVGVRVQFYVPGYIDTGQAFGLPLKLPKSNPDAFARLVVKDLGYETGVRYFPFFWRYICVALRLMPWGIYRRLRF
jgi:short-subunit dehydrogenase